MELNGQPVAQDWMRADVRHISTEKREERGREGGAEEEGRGRRRKRGNKTTTTTKNVQLEWQPEYTHDSTEIYRMLRDRMAVQ